MFLDEWSPQYIKKVIRKSYIKMLRDNDGTQINLGNILGDTYTNIYLQFKYTNGKLESVFPIVKGL